MLRRNGRGQGVLRFKLKCKRMLKFRTAAKSLDVPLSQFLDPLGPGGFTAEENETAVDMLADKKTAAKLCILVSFTGDPMAA
eukprot:COSAG01_NODE_144_length_24108_cov_11.490441_22_plen_82_part_00